MTSIWFTSDTHFFHENVIEFCNRPFSSLEEMHEVLIDRWNSRIHRGDLVYHLGDFALTWSENTQGIENLLKRLNGSKHLITGNHDRSAVKKAKGWATVRDYARIKWKGQSIVLLHYAMRVWHGSHRGAWHLYGHSHGSLKDDPNSKSLDVGVDAWDYYPVSFDEIKERMDQKVFVPVDHHSEGVMKPTRRVEDVR